MLLDRLRDRVCFEMTETVGVKDPVEVIELVLEYARKPACGVDSERGTGTVLRLKQGTMRTQQRLPKTRDRQAAL